MWPVSSIFAIVVAQAEPSPPAKWCFERTQGALLCEATEVECNNLRSINDEIAISPCKRIETPEPQKSPIEPPKEQTK